MNNFTENIITPEEAGSLYGLFNERVKRTPDRPAYSYFDETSDSWKSCTWSEMDFEVARWQSALSNEKLRPGDRVAIWICNCKKNKTPTPTSKPLLCINRKRTRN